jgi:hypothetical protein
VWYKFTSVSEVFAASIFRAISHHPDHYMALQPKRYPSTDVSIPNYTYLVSTNVNAENKQTKLYGICFERPGLHIVYACKTSKQKVRKVFNTGKKT